MAHGYAFPPVHGFAPFYTLQPNPKTAVVQIEMWAQIVLGYCEANQRYTLHATGSWELQSPLFCNRVLDRAVSPAMMRIIFAYLVDHAQALYEPAAPKHAKPPRVGTVEADRFTHAESATAARSGPSDAPFSSILVLWKSPEAWGDGMYAWICNTGQNGSVLTMTELVHGELALQTQVRKGRAQVFGAQTARIAAYAGNDLLANAGEEALWDLGVKFV
ncbi:hypothetical protein MVES_003271 [Malassezia vespertilionis]|uniref:ESCRT-II complex subunit VPS25 n=1 Tax=Malassezia vespertilionis TaxID=2020962 RepID=A0A2N1J8H2_9BASI|nr:hypothetical protein MVES_003271 [Malassezia vespertilionis]